MGNEAGDKPLWSREGVNPCMHEWTLMAHGLYALFWKRSDLQPLIDSDFELELSTNHQLALEISHKREQARAEREPVIRKRVSILRRGLIASFIFLGSAVALALIVAFGWRAPGTVKSCLGGISIFCFSWSTLARLGYSGTSFSGDSVIERLDLRIFWLLYWLGTFAGTFALIE